MKKLVILFMLSMVVVVNIPCYALDYYQVGTPTLTEIWVDPELGNDLNTGTSAASALRTITTAWGRIPSGNTLTSTGYRINLMPGAYPCEPGPEADNCVNFFSDRTGTSLFPVIVRAVGGPGTAYIRGGMDISGVSYIYLIDLDLVGGADLPTNSSGNNLLHLAGSDHVLLRGLTLSGPSCDNDTCNNLQEVLKVNQTRHLYVEDSTIGGAWHSSVDYMVVQYGHFINSRVHTAGQWCVYVKGGSSYLRFEGNELYGCQLGFSAGQAANLAVMRSPWLHYEAYDIKFINNVLHDLPGVGLSASGGYNILFAHNTLYNIGTSEIGYGLVQMSLGGRNCTATDEIPNPASVCSSITAAGGWGPDFVTETLDIIPNRNVFVYNNIFYNPSPSITLYSHFVIGGPVTPPAGVRNIAAPARTDDGLVMKGNIIWNGPADHPLGIEEVEQGCQASNPTCNANQLKTDNAINTITPQLVAPAAGNFRPLSGGNLYSASAYAIPDFSWSDAPAAPAVPQGNLSNSVSPDRDGVARMSAGPAGAYLSSAGPMAVPGAAYFFEPYLPIEAPLLSADPASAQPFAVGPIASGSSLLRLQVGTLPFAGPVDIYAAIQSQQLGPGLWLIDSDTSLRPLSQQGLVKWKGRWNGPVSASLFGDIDPGMLPKGRYDLYLMVTPPGSLGAYYLWATYFDVP